MSKIKIILFEDNEDDITLISNTLHQHDFEIAGVAKSFSDGISLIKSKEFDIAIVDIFIKRQPEGILFADELSSNVPFIFLTSSLDRDVFSRAKLANPYSYLIKPFNQLELLFAIELAIEKASDSSATFAQDKLIYYNDSFFVKEGRSLVKIRLRDILYVTVHRQYCKMVTDRGAFIIQISLNKFMTQMPDTSFQRSHRNFLVNINRIDKIYPEDNLIILDNEERILISRRYKNVFFKKYKIFK